MPRCRRCLKTPTTFWKHRTKRATMVTQHLLPSTTCRTCSPVSIALLPRSTLTFAVINESGTVAEVGPNDMAPAASTINDDSIDPFAGAITFSDAEERPDKDVHSPGGSENQQVDEMEPEGTWEAPTGGSLSNEAQKEARELGDFVRKESDRIALKFKKSRREVILAAGLALRAGRRPNCFNMFRKWYSHLNPRDDAKESKYYYSMLYSYTKLRSKHLLSTGNA